MTTAPRPCRRITMSFRVDPDLAAEVRTFVRDNAGRPFYFKIGSFIDDALRRQLDHMAVEIERRRAKQSKS